MRRFFRSAAFPILIVIVLAFFAQRLISPGTQEQTPSYDEFLSQVKNQPTSIRSVTFQQKTNTIDVEQQDEKTYSTGYPTTGNAQTQLVNLLAKKHVQTVSAPNVTGQSNLEVVLRDMLGNEICRVPYLGKTD